MQYVGSKNRLSKYIVPIIQSKINDETKGYIEPFVGGANIIDKINCKNKIGCDINGYLISLLRIVRDKPNLLPDTITEQEYIKVRDNKDKYDKWFVGLVGFCATYGSKWFGGYARGVKSDGITKRDIPNEAIRNLLKQSKRIRDCKFKNISYLDIPDVEGYVIYCDPPYRGATGYKDSINYEQFYNWCRKMSKKNIVIISEYDMPIDFKCIWEYEHKTTLKVNKHEKRIEKLFVLGE